MILPKCILWEYDWTLFPNGYALRLTGKRAAGRIQPLLGLLSIRLDDSYIPAYNNAIYDL